MVKDEFLTIVLERVIDKTQVSNRENIIIDFAVDNNIAQHDNFRGEWHLFKDYKKGDIVSYEDIFFQAEVDNSGNEPLIGDEWYCLLSYEISKSDSISVSRWESGLTKFSIKLRKFKKFLALLERAGIEISDLSDDIFGDLL